MRTAIPRVAPEVNHNIVPPALSLLPHISHFVIDGYVTSATRPRPQANCPYSLHACAYSIRKSALTLRQSAQVCNLRAAKVLHFVVLTL